MALVLDYVTPQSRTPPRFILVPILLCYIFIPLVAWQGCAMIGEAQHLFGRPKADLVRWFAAEGERRDWVRNQRAGIPLSSPEPPVPLPTDLGEFRDVVIIGSNIISMVAVVAFLLRLIRSGWSRPTILQLRQLCLGATAIAAASICVALACMGRTCGPAFSYETYFSGYCSITVTATLLGVLVFAKHHNQRGGKYYR